MNCMASIPVPTTGTPDGSDPPAFSQCTIDATQSCAIAENKTCSMDIVIDCFIANDPATNSDAGVGGTCVLNATVANECIPGSTDDECYVKTDKESTCIADFNSGLCTAELDYECTLTTN